MPTATKTKSSKPRNVAKPSGPSPEEKLTERLIALLEQGVNPWRREWRGNSGGQHRNLLTKKPYRGGNPILLEFELALRNGGVPLWLGFNQGKTKGWFPKKGSSAAYVLRPNPVKVDAVDADGKPVLNEQGEQLTRAWTAFKPVPVFNAADMEGEGLADAIAAALGQQVDRPAAERIDHAHAVLEAWPVSTQFYGDRAFYSPGGDSITIPPLSAFDSSEAFYATWAHEQVHSTGHSSRLARDLGGRFGDSSYAREELVAELGAFLLCNRLEISSNAQNHAAYLQSWLSVLKQGPKTLLRVVGDATKAANLLLPEQIEAAAG